MKILITGPESTGKSTLAMQLALHYDLRCVGEYARKYMDKLGRPYNAEDVESIAKESIRIYDEVKTIPGFVMDTYLINLKIWMLEKYTRCPAWIEDAISRSKFDIILLSAIDLPWVYDPLRESENKRKHLFERFEEELQLYHPDYHVISGLHNKRLENAIKCIDNYTAR